MEDTSGRKGPRELCNETLADACWGVVSDNKWIWSGLPVSLDRPTNANSNELITYSDWATRCHPDVVASALESQDAARVAAARAKSMRDRLRGTFAEPGGDAPFEVAKLLPGLLRSLSIPPHVRKLDGAATAGLATRDTWLLLPSWLAGIRTLLESEISDSLALSLQFRTFGSDHAAVAREFNTFAVGKHPLHPGFRCDGSDGSIDRRIRLHGDYYGTYYRDDDGPVLFTGGNAQPDVSTIRSRTDAFSIARQVGSRFACGVRDIDELIGETCASGATVWLRDHWLHWRDKGEEAAAGKLHIVGTLGVHSLFIDDNARGPDGHIVDVRDSLSGKRLPWADALAGGHVATAWPYAALTDDEYFVKLFRSAADVCLGNFSQSDSSRM